MSELDLSGKGIGDEQVSDSAPLVRALVIQRLEMIWSTVEPHVTGQAGRPDPRFIEAGIRVLDRLSRLYRLDQPQPNPESADHDVVPKADLVLKGLQELEARMNDGTL